MWDEGDIFMQLQLDLDRGKSNKFSVGKNAIDSIIELLDSTTSYFQCTNIVTSKSLKDFFKGFTDLCLDLLNETDISVVKKRLSKFSLSKACHIEDYFDDPIKDYSDIQLKYLRKCKFSKKQQGAFYTPKDVIENVLKSACQTWKFNKKDITKSSIVDPTMGASDWIYNWFVMSLEQKDKVSTVEKKRIFKNNIHGIDLDPIAVLTSRLIFWHQFDYSSDAVSMIKANLIKGDALDPLKGKFPFRQKKFDIVVGNPPYVVKNLSDINCYTNKTNNLYSAITESATYLLKDGGKICFVIPLSFVCSKKISDLRDFCVDNYNEINYSSYAIRPMKMFEGVDQRISIFIGTKKNKCEEKCSLYSSGGYFRWREREDLIDLLANLDAKVSVDISDMGFNNLWPKLNNQIEVGIIK